MFERGSRIQLEVVEEGKWIEGYESYLIRFTGPYYGLISDAQGSSFSPFTIIDFFDLPCFEL